MGTRISDKLKNGKGILTTTDIEQAGPPVSAAPQPLRNQVKQGVLPLTPAAEPATYYHLQKEDLNTSRLMKSMYGKEVPNDPTQAIQYVLQLPLGLSPERDDYYSKKAAQLEERRAKAQELFNKRSDWNGWLQIAETIGQGLVQLGAAKAGQKYGFDSTQVKISPIDWDKKYSNMIRELDTQLKSADRQLEAVAKDKTAEEQQYEQIRRDVAGNILKSAFIAEQERLKEERAKKGEQKEAGRQVTKTAEERLADFQKRLSTTVGQYKETRSKLALGLKDKNTPLNTRKTLIANEIGKLAKANGISQKRVDEIADAYAKEESVESVLQYLDALPVVNYRPVIDKDDAPAIKAYLEGKYQPKEHIKQLWLYKYGFNE